MSDVFSRFPRGRNGRHTRRYLAQAGAAVAGSLLVVRATRPGLLLPVFAQDDDDHSSGQGDGHGRGRGRGRGRGGDDNEEDQRQDDRDEGQEGAALSGQVPAGAIEIRIVSDDAGGFAPGDLTVDIGQTVAFVNTHSDEHTATGSGFDTGIIPEGGVASVVLRKPGIFRYACRIHPEMTGQVAVRDANGVVPPPATPAASPVAGTAEVRIVDLAFDPPTITVQAGSTVTWRNDDVTPHTVTADDGQFNSGIFDPGASFSWTFPTAGTFAYHCQVHPSMQGSVMVTD